MNNMTYGYSSPAFSSSPAYSSPFSSTPSGIRPSRPRFSYSGPTYPRPRSSASKPNPDSYNDSMVNNYGGSTNRMDSTYGDGLSGNNYSNYPSSNDSSTYFTANETFYNRTPVIEDKFQDVSMQYPSLPYHGGNALLEEPNNKGDYKDSKPFPNRFSKSPNFQPLGSFSPAIFKTSAAPNKFKKKTFPPRKFGKAKRTMANKDNKGKPMSWRCQLCDIDFNSQIPLDMHLRGAKHAKKLKAKGIVQVEPPQAKVPEGETEKKTLYCAVCNVHANSTLQMQTHLDGSKHKTKVQETSKPEEQIVKPDFNGKSNGAVTRPLPSDFELPQPAKLSKFSCDICNISMNSSTQLSQHLSSKKHQAKVEGKPLVKPKRMKPAVEDNTEGGNNDTEGGNNNTEGGNNNTEGGNNEVPTSMDTSSNSKGTVMGVQSLTASFVPSGTL